MEEAVAREKHYVEVIADTDTDGNVMPVAIIWDDGRRYDIDRVMESRPTCSLKTGGKGMRYTIRLGGRFKYLFYEGPRWFVEARVPQNV
jgi:hypothetical protein